MNELFYIMTQYCYQTECSSEEISANFKANLFLLTAAVNDIAELLLGPGKAVEWEDLDKCYKQYLGLGQGVGKIMRIIFNFDYSKVQPALF